MPRFFDALGAQRIDGGAVGEEHVVHGAGGGAQVAIARARGRRGSG